MIGKNQKTARLCAIGAMIFAAGGAGADPGGFPTHCLAGEVPILNALMGQIDRTVSQLKIDKNGKLLSLCADRETEPFGRVTYRYGRPGQVEMEHSASPAHKFRVFGWGEVHVGQEVTYFPVGPLTYKVSIADGMGSGVSLEVYNGKQKIVSLFSGNDEGVDFELGPAHIDVEHPASPVLELRKLPDSMLN